MGTGGRGDSPKDLVIRLAFTEVLNTMGTEGRGDSPKDLVLRLAFTEALRKRSK